MQWGVHISHLLENLLHQYPVPFASQKICNDSTLVQECSENTAHKYNYFVWQL